MSSPEVSIIIATYNRSCLIGNMLHSIQDQTFKSWECIIVDDGSSDNTRNVIYDFTAVDSRFKYFFRSSAYRKGLPGSRNMGLDHIKGNYIIFFDDDDIAHPQNLETCLKVLKETGVFFCRYDKKPFFTRKFDNAFEKIGEVSSRSFSVKDIDKFITGELPFASCTVMWKKECFNDIRFDEELMFAEEWECYTRILIEGYMGKTIDQVLYFNRKHENSNTGEFYKKYSIRRKSYAKAIKKVGGHLSDKKLYSLKTEKFLLRLGFFLRDYSVIDSALRNSGAGWIKRFKYLAGFKLYPIIRPIFVLKKKLKDQLN